jgi:peroxiredoxin
MGLFAADAPRRAPGFSIPDSRMKLFDLYDYRGKPVILEFMQTTCPHCGAFTSILAKVQEKYGNKVAILAVANPPDNQSSVGQFITNHKITWPILFDMGQVAYSYVLKPSFDLPQLFLIDASGMIYSSFGYSPMTRDIFEGNGLLVEVGRMLLQGGSAPTGAKTPPAKKN